ncbi:hypothetical protein DXG01_012389 [Tephrocybe rancida]|nr:hypothetical protein DXG01_012389 [Tephrocybe rancida]
MIASLRSFIDIIHLTFPTFPTFPSSSSSPSQRAQARLSTDASSPLGSPTQYDSKRDGGTDKFIALKLREAVWADASELRLERGEAFMDLFDQAQPRARLGDIVRYLGVRDWIICVGAPPEPSSSSAPYTGQAGSGSNVTLGTFPPPSLPPSPSPFLADPKTVVTPPPDPAPREESTESKPRLFPPGSTYHVLSSSPSSPTHTSYPLSASTSTLSLLPHRGSPTLTLKPSTSLPSSFLSLSSSKPKSPTPAPHLQIRGVPKEATNPNAYDHSELGPKECRAHPSPLAQDGHVDPENEG